MTNTPAIVATPNPRLILNSLLRADFIVFLKNRRSLILSVLLPYLILVSTNSKKGTANLGGPLFVIGLSITYGIASTSIMGYSLATARDREKGVFQRLRVTPASTGAIMGSRLIVQLLANLIIALLSSSSAPGSTIFRFPPASTGWSSWFRSWAAPCSCASGRRWSLW